MTYEEKMKKERDIMYRKYESLISDMFSYFLQQEYNYIDESEPIRDEKLIFMINDIFDFTTYDGGVSYKIGLKLYDVIESILNRKTFDYISNEDNYLNYIIMMKQLERACEWGSSIRGAWFNDYGATFIISCESVWNFGNYIDVNKNILLSKHKDILSKDTEDEVNITYGNVFFQALYDFINNDLGYKDYNNTVVYHR